MEPNASSLTSTPVMFPDELTESIISFLPVQEAVCAGLVAKRFLNSWKWSRDLTFDSASLARRKGIDACEIIQQIMDEHSGPVIERLRIVNVFLSGKEHLVYEHLVHDWIRKAIAKGVQELDLDFSFHQPPFVLTPDILDGERLRVFKVRYCDLRSFDDQFRGLRYLKTLTFQNIPIPSSFSEIIGRCIFLENFEINQCYAENELLTIEGTNLKKFICLKVVCFHSLLNMSVDAPSLQVFHYKGDIGQIVFESEMKNMVESVLHINPTKNVLGFPGIENLMMALRFTKVLSISSALLEWLYEKFLNCENKEFQLCLRNISEIRLCLVGTLGYTLKPTFLSPYDIARFLSNCPCIEKLTMDFGFYPLESQYYCQNDSEHNLATCPAKCSCLKSVLLKNFKFRNLEIQLAKFVITESKLLENLVVVKSKMYQGEKLDETCFRYWLAARELKIATFTILEFDEYMGI